MKKTVFILLSTFILLFFAAVVLNKDVTTKQCINYQCGQKSIPLYLKALDFFDRHYNYKHLARAITKGAIDEEDKAIRIFAWTCKNIKMVPAEFPVIDDHIWYTIIRGCAVKDQFSDIFTTLCNYAGIDAFFGNLTSKNNANIITLSFVKIKGRWTVFDPANGNYFKDSSGNLSRIDDLRSGGGWELCSLKELPPDQSQGERYVEFFAGLPSIERIGLNRANIQSPFNRLLFQIQNFLRRYLPAITKRGILSESQLC